MKRKPRWEDYTELCQRLDAARDHCQKEVEAWQTRRQLWNEQNRDDTRQLLASIYRLHDGFHQDEVPSAELLQQVKQDCEAFWSQITAIWTEGDQMLLEADALSLPVVWLVHEERALVARLLHLSERVCWSSSCPVRSDLRHVDFEAQDQTPDSIIQLWYDMDERHDQWHEERQKTEQHLRQRMQNEWQPLHRRLSDPSVTLEDIHSWMELGNILSEEHDQRSQQLEEQNAKNPQLLQEQRQHIQQRLANCAETTTATATEP